MGSVRTSRCILMPMVVLTFFLICICAAQERPVVRMQVFHASHCASCRVVERDRLDVLAKRVGCTIETRYHDINEPENYLFFTRLETKLDDEGNEFPAVVLGKTVLGGAEEIEARLEETVRAAALSGEAGEYAHIGPPSDAEADSGPTADSEVSSETSVQSGPVDAGVADVKTASDGNGGPSTASHVWLLAGVGVCVAVLVLVLILRN